MSEPKLSLCMIVKDEEDMLPRCLSSVRDYVDEIVVVDTGSTDKTFEIAKGFGAKVYHHPWEDDFSKHRNQSIGYATGDWFLILDADEEIIEGTGALIKKAVKNPDVDSITFQVISLYAGGKRSLHTQERLFRNNIGIRYEGRIHNRITGVKTTGFYPVKILHHGYNVPEKKGKLKHERRVKILQKEIEGDPRNPTFHHYLAASYLSAPDYEMAAQESLTALRLAEEEDKGGSSNFAWTYYIAASSLCQLSRIEKSEEICSLGLQRFPRDLDLHFTACQIAFKKKEQEKLTLHADRYLTLHAEISQNPVKNGMVHCVTFDQIWRIYWFMAMKHYREGNMEEFNRDMKGALDIAPKRSGVFHATGKYHMENGELEKAGSEMKKALSEDREDMEILCSQVELYIRTGDEAEEIRAWQDLLARFPEKREPLIADATQAIDDGRLSAASRLLKTLLGMYPRDPAILRLMIRCAQKRGDMDEETMYLKKLLTMDQVSVDDIIRLGFLHLRRSVPEDALECFQRAAEREPDRASAHLGLSASYWRSGELEPCVSELDRSMQLCDTSFDMEINSVQELGTLFILAAESLLAREETDSALTAYEVAIEMNCRIPEVYEGLGKTLRKAGRLEESLENFQTAFKFTDNPGPILKELGDIYSLMGKEEAAELCYQKSDLVNIPSS